MDGAEVSQGGRCGESECSVAFISTSTTVWKFLRFALNYIKVLQAAGPLSFVFSF